MRELLTSGKVSVEVIVDGRGPPIVLLPSSLRDSEEFDAVAARIAAAGYRVLRPQPRGMGASRGPMKKLDLRVLAGDVALAIERLGGGGPAVLVGHAFGQYVARMTAVEHPHLVRGVVLAAAAAKDYDPALRLSLRAAADPALPREERLRHLGIAFFAPGHDASPWLQGWHPELAAAYAPASAMDKSLWWSAGAAPILDLQAALDPWRPRSTRNQIREELGERVTVEVIPDASHALFPEQPELTVKAILAWCRGLPG